MNIFSLGNMVAQRRQAHALERIDDAFTEEIQRLERLIEEKDEQIRKLTLGKNVFEAHGEAMYAQAKALAEVAGPDAPLMAPTGRTNGEGKPERVIHRDIYNPTFDAFLKSKGVKDPEKYRV